jgi:hypothetical protein
MKIFYYCSVGTNLSLLAANLHLGVIKSAEDCREIIYLPYFHCLNRDEIGTPLKIGTDEFGNEIYTFGVKRENILLTKALRDWLQILGIGERDYCLIDLTKLEVPILRLANFTAIILGLKTLGKHIAAQGLRKQVLKVNKIVEKCKEEYIAVI